MEHIIPYSVSLDDSFRNKTLCHAETNRKRKRKHTPWQAFSENKNEYELMLTRVAKFDSPHKTEKLRRFELESTDEFDDFSSRQLNDTSYAAKLAKAYVESLYGGTYDKDGKMRVVAVSGGITAIIRNFCRLNHILNDGGTKTRDDHRHHAVDAVAIALASSAIIQSISKTAETWEANNPRLMHQGDRDDMPWEDFDADVRDAVLAINVLHSVSRKVRGALHAETIYGCVKTPDGNVVPGKATKRCKLASISEKEVNGIIDPVVKKQVIDKFVELGIATQDERGKLKIDEKRQKSIFDDANNYPRMPTREDGSPGQIIKTVKCGINLITVVIGNAKHARAVGTDGNHHMEIFETKDKKGNTVWDGVCVSMLEAYQRKRANEPIIQRDHGSGKRFLFSLSCGDIVLAKLIGDDTSHLYVVRSIPQSKQLEFARLNDARKKAEIKSAKEWKTKTVSALPETGIRKVTLTPFGEVRNAND